MFKKNCPFCFSPVNDYEDNGKYIIECQDCLKKGITVRVESDNLEKTCSLWNERVFDNELLKNPDFALQEIKIFNNFIKKENSSITILKNYDKNCKLINFVYDLNRIDYGYLIFPNGDSIKCSNSHPEELLKYLGIDSIVPDIDEKIYMDLGIIRLCNHDNCLLIVLPKKVKKNQVNCIFNLLSTMNFGIINSYCIYEDRENDYSLNTFNDLNELMLYLDKVC